MNGTWLATVVIGLLLSGLPLTRIFLPAEFLRSAVWSLVLTAGAPLVSALRGLSLLFALLSSLPLLAAIVPTGVLSRSSPVPSLWGGAVFFVVFLRVVLLPGTFVRWSSVIRWEQEVVRRSHEKNWTSLRFAHLISDLTETGIRTWALGRQLAMTDTLETSRLTGMHVRILGLFCICIALDTFPREAPLPLTLSPWVLSSGKAILTLVILIISISNFINLVTKHNRLSISLDSLPLDRKYFALKRISENIRWLANPEHLLALLMQADVLAATLRISIT